MLEPQYVERTTVRFHAFFVSCIEPKATQKRSDMSTLSNVETRRGEAAPPDVRFTPDIIPEAKCSKTGVSVRYVHDPEKKWFVFRASYGREDKAQEIILKDGEFAYIAKRRTKKMVDGKPKVVLETLIPCLLFVYTTEDKARQYVKETLTLSFLAYYFDHTKEDGYKNPPVTISNREMENFILATCNQNEHLMFVQETQCHYKSGEKVQVIDGLFKGVEGKVARVCGQQRVVISLSKVGLVSTAYIPTAFLLPVGE